MQTFWNVTASQILISGVSPPPLAIHLPSGERATCSGLEFGGWSSGFGGLGLQVTVWGLGATWSAPLNTRFECKPPWRLQLSFSNLGFGAEGLGFGV